MKKRVLLAAGVLGLALLSGCGQSGAGSTTKAAAATTKAAAATTKAAAATTKAAAATTAAATTKAAAATTKAASGSAKTIKVGASPSPHAEILAAAKDALAKAGYDLKVVEYNDYVQPNMALSAGELDANYFQHLPYLEQFNKEKGTKIVSAGAIHYEPFGIYAGKTKSLADLKDGAKIAVPNDVTNEARALLLLADQGLIKVKDPTNINTTKKDITENPKKLDITEIEAAQLPRSLPDVDLAVINGNFAISAGLKVADALATEKASSVAATTYANIVAVRQGDEKSEKIQALVKALTSDDVKKFINGKYAGAVVPIF